MAPPKGFKPHNKQTYQQIKEYVESFGIKLFSTEKDFINSHSFLELECSCGNQYSQRVSSFKNRKKKQCPSCNKHTKTDYTDTQLNSMAECNNGELLSRDLKKSTITLRCKCGCQFTKKLKLFIRQVKGGNAGKCNDCNKNSGAKKREKSVQHWDSICNEYGFDLVHKDNINLTVKCQKCSGSHKITISNIMLKKHKYCKDCYVSSGLGISNFECEVRDYIQSILPKEEIIFNSRDIIKPQEIDILIPSKKIGIECNGVYWHSETHGKDNKYHLEKTQKSQQAGIQLIHIFDTEWSKNKEIVKSILKSKLGVSDRLFGRNTVVSEISSQESKEFLDRTHIQGNDKSSIKLGLKYKNKLVSVMTFTKPRFSSISDWELSRFSNELNTTVVGGASKLLSYFMKNYSGSILSYADRRYSNGNLYLALGFVEHHVVNPSYYYLKSGNLHRRQKFQKRLLASKLENFNESLTERENMKNHGFHRVWDCGNYAYLLIPTK